MFLWTHSQEMLVQTLLEISVYVQVCGNWPLTGQKARQEAQ